MYDALFVSNLCMHQNSMPLQGARKESLPGLRSGMSMALWLNTF